MGRDVVAITGAGRGIGFATARRFARQGALLALNYEKTKDTLEEITVVAKEHGGDVLLFQADVADHLQVEAFIAEAERKFGQIDVLVNNAGILHSVPTQDESWERFERMMAVNLGGTFATIRAVLPGMLKRKSGRIVNVASELGLIGFATYASYCASKGAVIALTKAVAKEVAPSNILVNCVAPGPVETHMLIHDTVEFNDETREQVPLKRFGQPDEIAAVIEFLAGPGGSFMVGQVVSPNGGAAI
ncbi:3-oxoacyl-ACP reductase family protein [Paraburkholderia sp. BL10I2N1]|uniref:SDR family NAD(P)-dependent oxidoreductase n=1 Tax=Paraburkholderia sp. BL10I2N1 TaxID=1938796 RepID=UPI00105BBE86|nr:3-oxoacyl-ACP reductase family protein [Paraburkholderia sp. BL10I2N1]TDN58706.1 3-oxoacyl-[acyl-carrier protein] reductase [Paraburkholderia sp. BL10I2N1]